MKQYFIAIAAVAFSSCAKKEDAAPLIMASSRSADVTISEQYGVIHAKPYFMQNNFWNKGIATT